MHKRETSKILMITLGVLIVIVLNAWILITQEADVTEVPETEHARDPVPDFASFDDVTEKKQAFYQYLLPEVTRQNDYLLNLRHYLIMLRRQLDDQIPLTNEQQERLSWLLDEYRVDSEQTHRQQVIALLNKVDIVPAELVLAQAANESAWGTSRFAREGYNFFGLWCFKKGCGFVPSRRGEGAEHEVARFESVSRATYVYLRNLNRHEAYHKLRDIRASLRKAGQPIDALALAEGLTQYSERGNEYVLELQAMIRTNQPYVTEEIMSE